MLISNQVVEPPTHFTSSWFPMHNCTYKTKARNNSVFIDADKVKRFSVYAFITFIINYSKICHVVWQNYHWDFPDFKPEEDINQAYSNRCVNWRHSVHTLREAVSHGPCVSPFNRKNVFFPVHYNHWYLWKCFANVCYSSCHLRLPRKKPNLKIKNISL